MRVLAAIGVLTAALYFAWWVTPGRAGTPALFVLLAVAEGFTMIHLLGLWWAIWATRFDPPPQFRTSLSVDVFVPTKGEPIDVLKKTIAAAVDLAGDHRTFVLDDGKRAKVRELAAALGAGYIRRSGRRGAKAGNLNHALSQTDGDLVAIFDADHVPRRDFLTRIVGYFRDPRIAFVQTPQFYRNAKDNAVARGAYQQQAIFYGPILRGKNGLGAAFCCGTNVVLRRRALESVNGFDEESVVEDFVTSMRLHRNGWRSVYYPYVLAEGLGPSSLAAYFGQQFRWARGSIGALVSGEPFKPGFTWAQRFQYLLATTFYLVGLITPIYMLLPILYLFGGLSVFSGESGTFVFFYAPYFATALLSIRAAMGGRLRVEHLRFTFGAFPAYAVAGLAALFRRPAGFRVTAKRPGHPARTPALALVTVAMFIVTAVAIPVGLSIQPQNARTFTNASWAAVNLLLLSGIAGVAVRELIAVRRRRVPALSPDGAVVPVHPSPQLADRTLPLREPIARSVHARFRPGLQVAVLMLVALVLRVVLSGTQGLRLDESLSLEQAQFPLGELWRFQLGLNVHVPLYHTILHFWLPLAGTSEWALRIPSIAMGVATVPLFYVVGRRLVGPSAGIFAAVLGAASPFLIWHGYEARMYPMVLLLSLGAVASLQWASTVGGVGRWGLYALLTALSLYTHYFAALMLPVHLAYLLIFRMGRARVLAWLAAVGVAVLAFLPWAAALYFGRIQEAGLGSLAAGIRPPPVDYSVYGVIYGLLAFLTVYLAGYLTGPVLGAVSALVVGLWPLAALRVATGRTVSWLHSRTALFLLSWLLFTVGVVFVFNIVKPGLLIQKYLIIAIPPVIIATAVGLSRVLRPRAVEVGALLLVLTAIALTQAAHPNIPVREDFREAAAIIRSEMSRGDSVAVMPNYNVGPLSYYLPNIDVRPVLAPGYVPSAVAVALPRIVLDTSGRSLWIVALYERTADPNNEVLRILDRSFERTARYELGSRMQVRRYRIPLTPLGVTEPASAEDRTGGRLTEREIRGR
jgi:cellulose synthase (UDP-forming)